MSDYLKDTHYALNALKGVAGRLASTTLKARYVLGESVLVADLDADLQIMLDSIQTLQEAIDADLQSQLKEAQGTVGGILHDLVEKSKN